MTQRTAGRMLPPFIMMEASMDIRKSAAALDDSERDRFLEAIILLKHRAAPNGPAGVSVYDQFTALHGAVFSVIAPGLPAGETVNFGHWNIGFCPWHRQYLRAFEKALQAEVPGVTVPYWDWSDHVGAITKVFVPEFLGSLGTGQPRPVADSVLRNPVPPTERPIWWPNGVNGYAIHPLLADGFGSKLSRGSFGVTWPAAVAGISQLEHLVIQQPDIHPLWYFWLVLEAGHWQIVSATHNTGHNLIGGHMSGGFSPNDPTFWLHHANVDRLWATWQANRLRAVAGSTPGAHWPLPADLSPFDGKPAPPGHRLNDQMWPWVGTAPGYDVDMDPAIQPLLPDFSAAPAVTVNDVLDTEAMDAVGYRYAAP
jgi:tyrosinase